MSKEVGGDGGHTKTAKSASSTTVEDAMANPSDDQDSNDGMEYCEVNQWEVLKTLLIDGYKFNDDVDLGKETRAKKKEKIDKENVTNKKVRIKGGQMIVCCSACRGTWISRLDLQCPRCGSCECEVMAEEDMNKGNATWRPVGTCDDDTDHPYSTSNPKIALNPLIEVRPQSLNPATQKESAEWEYVEAILDSGATVTVFPPSVGKAYAIQEGEAARAGVTYEIANGEEIPNLGEKLMPIMTNEGSMRGLKAQIANVTKPLQAVRSLIKTGHLVVFGDGDGDEHYVLNKITGEKNAIRDDGVNYLMSMYVVPPEAAGFGRPAQNP